MGNAHDPCALITWELTGRAPAGPLHREAGREPYEPNPGGPTYLDRFALEFPFDSVRLFPSPRAVVDPMGVAGDIVVAVDCLG